ncbi:MAG: hypothetical protein LBJ95_04640 [Oscillospiraceae bacterium]|nr:hypothetical protein [Oscillospiraceae bacterium]
MSKVSDVEVYDCVASPWPEGGVFFEVVKGPVLCWPPPTSRFLPWDSDRTAPGSR